MSGTSGPHLPEQTAHIPCANIAGAGASAGAAGSSIIELLAVHCKEVAATAMLCALCLCCCTRLPNACPHKYVQQHTIVGQVIKCSCT
eukprot:1158308-Pelagomonas_calceolata.AAC.1